MAVQVDVIESPVGPLVAVVNEGGSLAGLEFADAPDRVERVLGRYRDVAQGRDPLGMRGRLERYFAKDWTAFDGLPLAAVGTPFQQRVWRELCAIPVGKTVSYGDIAHRIDSPRGLRAVGLANGSNPIAIIVPCHRVIGSNGSLTGYGGGIERKRWLLVHEGALLV